VGPLKRGYLGACQLHILEAAGDGCKIIAILSGHEGGWPMLNRFWPGAALACLVPAACTSDAAEVVAPIAETAPYAEAQARNAVTDTLTDREILEVFYHATGGPDWDYQGGWMSEPSIANWEGVGVDTAGRVQALWLPYNNLSGSIPPELGSLTKLVELQLPENRLTGSIPGELGGLGNLEDLDLSFNRLTGSIPAGFGNLSSLVRLNLWANQLTGSIPAALGDLSSLEVLDLDENGLTGSIPPEPYILL